MYTYTGVPRYQNKQVDDSRIMINNVEKVYDIRKLSIVEYVDNPKCLILYVQKTLTLE